MRLCRAIINFIDGSFDARIHREAFLIHKAIALAFNRRSISCIILDEIIHQPIHFAASPVLSIDKPTLSGRHAEHITPRFISEISANRNQGRISPGGDFCVHAFDKNPIIPPAAVPARSSFDCQIPADRRHRRRLSIEQPNTIIGLIPHFASLPANRQCPAALRRHT